jgi:hypothetical protein
VHACGGAERRCRDQRPEGGEVSPEQGHALPGTGEQLTIGIDGAVLAAIDKLNVR